MASELETVEQQWNEQADEWNRSIGDDGDVNRRESSDQYLWKYISDVQNQVVLDAGCGNGYLTIKLAREATAKRVIGVDLSSSMVEWAKKNVDRLVKDKYVKGRIDLHHDSITELKSIGTNTIDLIVSNYVLMDTPDLDQVIKAFARVLKPSGRLIIVILHPCFDMVPSKDGPRRIYTWSRSYFDQSVSQQKWEKFSANMYHRPLSVYFQAFHQNELTLVDFDEPRFFSPIHQYDCTCAAVFHLKKND